MGDFQPEDVEAFNNENMGGKVPLGEGPEPIAIVGMGQSLNRSRLVCKPLT